MLVEVTPVPGKLVEAMEDLEDSAEGSAEENLEVSADGSAAEILAGSASSS